MAFEDSGSLIFFKLLTSPRWLVLLCALLTPLYENSKHCY